MNTGNTAEGFDFTKEDKDILKKRREIPRIVLYILMAVYIITSVLVTIAARSQEIIMIGNRTLPVSSFAGVLSSIANMSIIFMVVFFDRLGFITSLILLVLQFPLMARGLFLQNTLSSLPGIFSNLLAITAIIMIRRRNRTISEYQESRLEQLKKEQMFSQYLFEQTATSLVNAVDAKDTYSHGHSVRVAAYSRKIAVMMGKSEEECYKIYYAALLHDVGKIGISDSIINKNGRLTDEEYSVIKQHPFMGYQILSSIREYPYLNVGAHYHHERYDGKGYPDGLKGEDIPEIARIISVADAYDAMTSNRSYRDAIPQQIVREELVEGSGTQFDPAITETMLQIIDSDPDYEFRERPVISELNGKTELVCESYRSEISDGILISQYTTKVAFRYSPGEGAENGGHRGTIILFDSLDGIVHTGEEAIRELYYYEYCVINLDGTYDPKGVRKVQEKLIRKKKRPAGYDSNFTYVITASKYKDHVLLTVDDGGTATEFIIALPDSSRFVYIGLTGENCSIRDVSIERDRDVINPDHIPRIADKISYIDGNEGDIPNVQIDGTMTEASEGIPITDGLKISFHTKSLPTARLIWHCPYICIFHAGNRTVGGVNYREYAMIRLDGEITGNNDISENKTILNKTDDFNGWDEWKKYNKEGFDCVVSFERNGNRIITDTNNFGISIRNITTIKDGTTDLYAALTGDQCALTNIRMAPRDGVTGPF